MAAIEESQLTIYNLQSNPECIVLIALGLAGTEQSPYFVDLVEQLSKRSLIIGVRGVETSSHCKNQRIFLKNDCSRITRVMKWIYDSFPGKPKIGIGMSLGGALLLRHQSRSEFPFDEIIVACTSLWYENAVHTMSSSFFGVLVNKLLTWWQFERLFFGENYLTQVKHPAFCQWIQLFCAPNLLNQDRILCELYDIDYSEYINDLDMRWMTKRVRGVNYLLSSKDPMFSPSHLKATMEALEGSMFNYEIVDFGGHGDFTVHTRNDYLIKYCENVITRVITGSSE